MICLPIMAASNGEARELLSKATTQPADLYELRFDRLEDAPDVEGLIAYANRPVIATCRSKEQGGFFTGTVVERIHLLQRAVDAGACYVDAEEDVIGELKRKDDVVLIASWHNFTSTPDNLDSIVARLEALPCDWIKFAVMVTKIKDNQTVLQTIERCTKPVIAIGMGEMGLPSRILGPAFGSKITFGCLSDGFESAPGQPGAADLAEYYRVGTVTRNTAVYGLIGNPVAQSQGYKIHNKGFSIAGVDAVYIPFLCPDAGEFSREFAEALNIKGLSVTIPHKSAIMSFADHRTEGVRNVGAVNTLIHKSEGWFAENTDFLAVVSLIKDIAKKHEVALQDKPALLIGGGGAARAIGAAIASSGCTIHIAGRNDGKIQLLADEMGWRHVPWNERERDGWAVVANATSIGMRPDTESTSFSKAFWRKGMIAFDVVHYPSRTRFIREAEAAGVWTVNGMDMFTNQAAHQFTLWTGKLLPAESIQAIVNT